jgi:hypothetical protein
MLSEVITRKERRNVHAGAGAGFAILAVMVVFFNDASEGVQGAITVFALILTFAVYHTLDELEQRHERSDREDD